MTNRIYTGGLTATVPSAPDPLSVGADDFGGDYRDDTGPNQPQSGSKTSGLTKSDSVYDANSDSGSSLMQRIMDGSASRTAATDYRSRLFGGSDGPRNFSNFGGIADDQVLVVDPDGRTYTWSDIKEYYKEGGYTRTDLDSNGNPILLGYDEAGAPVYSTYTFDPSMTIDEWYDGYAQRWGMDINEQGQQTTFGDTGSGSGSRGGRGGSGAADATYIAPPANTVREQIRNYVIATTGTANQSIIDQGVAAYMAKDREAFDKRESESVDPWQFAKETVRGTKDYKAIHEGRPDSVDEMDWVTSRQAKLRQIGISDARAEQLGVNAAIAGSTDEALVGQAKAAQVADTGRLLQQHRDSLRQSAVAAAGLI